MLQTIAWELLVRPQDDSVCGLLKQLNILHETADHLGLVATSDKSTIVVFRNGGHIALSERWFYGQNALSVVIVCTYLGIRLSTKLSFPHALNDIAVRARKGVVNIFKLVWSLGKRSPSIFFNLFFCKIQPILNYGGEAQGL